MPYHKFKTKEMKMSVVTARELFSDIDEPTRRKVVGRIKALFSKGVDIQVVSEDSDPVFALVSRTEPKTSSTTESFGDWLTIQDCWRRFMTASRTTRLSIDVHGVCDMR